jgi:FAD/FMN-containing dehydrogenase
MVASFMDNPGVVLTSHTAGGAVSRVDELATAFPHRNAEAMLVYVGFWTDPALDERMIASTRAMSDVLAPYMGGYYDNIDYDDEGAGVSNYGPAYARLSRIKRRYDPDNLFRMNSNIEPA